MSDGRGGVSEGWRDTTRRDESLPWLESADDDYDGYRGGRGRGLIAVALAVAVIAAAAFVYWYSTGSTGPAGGGQLIAAPEGDYKVKPDQPGGMEVEGTGDQVFVTSQGGASNGSVDLSAVPEAPVDGTIARKGPAAPAKGSKRVVTSVPEPGGKLVLREPARKAPPTARSTAGGSVVQLGSFPSEGGANTAWKQLSSRFSYLTPLGKAVERAEVRGDTVYRLRVNAGSAAQARELCAKLKIAGEACFIASQ